VEDILSSGSSWVDRKGVERPVTLDDILIIAPYNSQVFELQARLPRARVGTVDKFQGQEAPVVIYSMTTSSHADAPRGSTWRRHVQNAYAFWSARLPFSTRNAEHLGICIWQMHFVGIWNWRP
jgi:hypothetical protein